MFFISSRKFLAIFSSIFFPPILSILLFWYTPIDAYYCFAHIS